MMKKLIMLVCFMMVTCSAFADPVSIAKGTAANYTGKIASVGVGFYEHVGVRLSGGDTCHGSNIIVLLNTDPQYKEMYSLLLSAYTTQSEINIHQLGAQDSTFGIGYCVINYISLGDFPNW